MVLGLEKIQRGSKWLFGEDATRWSITRIRRLGVAFIPENPLQMAAVPWLPVLFNSILTRTWALCPERRSENGLECRQKGPGCVV